MADGVIEEVLRIDPGQTKTALGDVAQEATKTSAALGAVTRSSGASSASLGQLAYQLNDVATMAALGASPLQILASQGGQIAQVFAQAGGASSAFAAAAAALAAQGALVYLALHDWNVEAGALHDATVAATKVHAQFAAVLEDTAAAEVALKVATGELTREQGLLETQALKTFKALREAVNASNTDMAALTTAQGSLTTQVVDFYEAWVPAWAPLKNAFSALTTSSEDYQLQIDAGREAQQANIASTKELRQTLQETASETEKARRATEAGAAARKAAAEAARAEREALAALKQEFTKESAAAAALDSIFGSDPVSETRAKFEAQTTALMQAVNIYRDMNVLGEHAAEIDRARLVLAQNYTEAMNAAYAAMQAQAEGSTAAGDAYDPASGASAGGSGYAGAVASGFSSARSGLSGIPGVMGAASDVAGLAGATGTAAGIAAAVPIVQAIISAIQFVNAIVPDGGRGGLLDSIHAEMMEFFENLGRLPDVLADALKRSVEEGFPALAEGVSSLLTGLIENLPSTIVSFIESAIMGVGTMIKLILRDLPAALMEGIRAFFSIDTWRPLLEGFADIMVDTFKDFFLDLLRQLAPGRQKGETRGDGIFRRGGFFDDAESIWSHPFESIGHAMKNVQVFADGTEYVSRTGIAMVHAGEEIRQAGGTWSTQAMYGAGSAGSSDTPGRARMSSRGGRLTFELDAADVAREFARARSAQGLEF